MEMKDIAITTEDVQAVIQSDPMVKLQIQTQALGRKLQEVTVAYEAAVRSQDWQKDDKEKEEGWVLAMARKPPLKLTSKQKEQLKDPKFAFALRAVKPLVRNVKRQRRSTP